MLELILQAMLRKNYRIFEDRKKDYNLNLVAVRTANPVIDQFRCWLYVFWPLSVNAWGLKRYRITTLPGRYYMEERLLDEKGCAILVPGQYLKSWQLGLHHHQYEALIQSGPVTVYRDGNEDEIFDYDPKTEERGLYGINIHRAGATGTVPYVGKYSAGCQVFQSGEDFLDFIELCKSAKDAWGNSFSYTLLEEQDLP